MNHRIRVWGGLLVFAFSGVRHLGEVGGGYTVDLASVINGIVVFFLEPDIIISISYHITRPTNL